MLRSVKSLYDYVLSAEDGMIGRCKDFLFDERMWTIRYMVADTGKWLPKRKVLISPISLGHPDWKARVFPVRLTKEQIKKAPSLESDAPVSRQHEIEWTQHFGWPYYWAGTLPWGITPNPGDLYHPKIRENKKNEIQENDNLSGSGDNCLRSSDEVTGYQIQATDDDIGHVEDFILNEETWVIQYMVVDTRNWLPGRKVLVAPNWIETVSWPLSTVSVGLTKEMVKESPTYDPSMPVNRKYEKQLYDFYGRPAYWN